MKRLPHVFFAFALVFPALAGCGGPPEGARKAQRHLVRGNYQAANQAADRSLRAHPKDPTSWRVKIRATMAQGDLAGAAAHYQEWKTLRGSHDRTAYRLMAVTTLWQGLRVPAPEIKTRAIQIVAEREIEKLATDVRDAMGDDNDLVAGAAAVALLRSHPAAPDLASELLKSADPRVRAMVVAGIGKKVGRLALGDIVDALGDRDPKVRRAAVSAIAGWKSKKDADRLVVLAKGDPDGQVRSRALRGLLPSGGKKALELARASLDDAYLGARLAALALIEKNAPEEALSIARSLLASTESALAMRAAVLLKNEDAAAARAAVAKAYDDANWATRSAALNTAAEVMDSASAIALAQRALADVNEEVRIAGARLLIRLGKQAEGLAALRTATESKTLGPRLAAATELARHDAPAAIELLGTIARTGTPEQRQSALAAHAAAGVVSDGLVAALGDDNISVRLAAADALLSL